MNICLTIYLQQAEKLTIAEYVLLREISSVGDVPIANANGQKPFKQLIDRGLLSESDINGTLFPTWEVRNILRNARNLLGINQL